ncbi:MAG: histidine kinase dimerization/phospho-acceptor domain-containing protein [Opitutales bacterium]|jgi:hypothetical protein|nr:histidine kinase dimerization/phospho-acceptor domain-containing protein [Opitutales bacterium]
MPRIFLITEDTKLRDAWNKLLDDLGDVEVSSAQDIRGKAERLRPCTIVYDLFQEKAPPYQEPGSGIHIIAVGSTGTVPFQQAIENNYFAVLDKETKEAHLREVTQHSQKILNLEEQNRFLQDRVIRLETLIEVDKESNTSPPYRPFDYASEILNRISSEKELGTHFLKLIQSHLRIPRSGIFINRGDRFTLLAGNLVFGDINELSYSTTHPFAEWLSENLITLRMRTVESILDEPDKLFLRDNLKRMQAEAIFPLFSDGGLSGWLFTGKRNDGQTYSQEVLEDLESIAEQFSACISLSRRQGSIQQEIQRAQLLLQSVPGKWVIANAQGEVVWQTQVGDPIPLQLKEALYVAAQSGTTTDSVVEGTKSSFRIFTRILPYSTSEYRIIGGYENVTDRLKSDYQERVDELDTIFNTLGLILSHELRNPLVSLKTFAQLLGVKDKDAPLPADFVATIQTEVERLEGVADDLFGLNDMGKQTIESTDIRMIINRIVQDLDHNIVTVKFGKNVNPFQGDAIKLEEGLKDMVLHMYESLKEDGNLVILVEGKQTKGTQITIRGGGIEEEKTFPNSKTKSQPEAISLKFFKACQTIKKHRGLVKIRKSKNGYDLQILIREPS